MKLPLIITVLTILTQTFRVQGQTAEEQIQSLLVQMRETSTNQPNEAILSGYRALKLLETADDRQSGADVLCEMSWAFVNLNDLDSAWVYAQRAQDQAVSINYPLGQACAIRVKGRILRNRGDFPAAIAVLDTGLQLSGKITGSSTHGRIFNEFGMIYRRQSRFDDALKAHHQALEIHRYNEEQREIANTLALIGIVHDMVGNYDNALRHHQESLDIRRALGDRRGVAGSLHNMGVLNQKIKDYPEALRLYQQALRVWEELGLRDETATTLNNIGAIHELLDDYQTAGIYYRQSLEMWQDLGDLQGINVALNNVASIEATLGRYTDALQMYRESLDIVVRLGDRFGIASTYNHMAGVYKSMGYPDSAVIMVQNSLGIAQEVKSWYLLEQSYYNLSSLYEGLGRYPEALEAYKNYIIAHDSLFNAESQKVIADLKTQYQAREQEQEIALLQHDRRVQQLWIVILLGGITFFMAIAVLLFNRYRLRRRAHIALKKMHEAEAEQARLRTEAAEARAGILHVENERKSRELQSARDLQLSMLPAKLPDHPLYDIAASMHTATEVGGDYYDFHVSENGTLTIAVGDATSHGIHAGTIVTATKSLFNLLADEPDLTTLLIKASTAMRKMNFQKLFMAFALVRLQGNNVQMIGAGMPPALVYRSAQKTIEQFSLNGLPLGAFGEYPYQLRETQLYKGDIILLSSDGFAELRDEREEMLGFDRLHHELLSVGDKSSQAILDHFISTANRWCDCKPFTDDMTFVSVKMR
jgi:serine phosphatase RsbU (regulator of sigma subunit)